MIPTYTVSGLANHLWQLTAAAVFIGIVAFAFAQEPGSVPVLHPYFVAVLHRQLFASGGSQNR
jgi:hypothetical protein